MGAPLRRRSCFSASSTRHHGRISISPAPPWALHRPRSTGAGARASACGCWTGWWPSITRGEAVARGRAARTALTCRAAHDCNWPADAMTEMLFYHLQRQPLERVLPTLIERSLERGWRVIVQAASEERVDALDSHL